MTIQNQWHAKIWTNNNGLLLQSIATPEDDDQLDDATGSQEIYYCATLRISL